MNRVRLITAAACLCSFFASVGAAQAAPGDPVFSCKASAARVSVLGNILAEPNIANGPDGNPCKDDFAQLPNIDQGTGQVLPAPFPTVQLTGSGLFARTSLTGEGGPTRDQTVRSDAGAASVKLEIKNGAATVLTLEVEGLTSQALASCTANNPRTPVLSSDYKTVLIKVNGMTVADTNAALQQITAALGPLAPLVDIKFGEKISSGTPASADQSETIRALHLKLLSAAGANPVADVVVGEATADRHGDVCAPPVPPPVVCPAGSVESPIGSGICVITVTQCPPNSTKNAQGQCVVNGDQTVCPTGSVKNAQGQCVITETNCPPNTTKNPQGQCVVNGDQTVCPPGSVKNPQGQCVVTQPDCPPPSVKNAQGQCVVAPADIQCPQGSANNGQGQCVVTETNCPAGSTKNAQGQCVVSNTTPGGGGGDNPTGATLIPLQQLLGAFSASPCTNKAFGSQIGLVGTDGVDRITGSNLSDRIFALGAGDRISGGRGNDCVEAGEGNDRADGSNGKDYLLGAGGRDILSGGPNGDHMEGGGAADKMFGGTGPDTMSGGPGNDKVVGGSGNDKLNGGAGNDVITGGNGRTRVLGGPGNDIINVATAGKPANVSCGAGRDVVRANSNDTVAKDCERVQNVRAGRTKKK